MPTYEYACKDCGNGFEVVQSFSDDALTLCPACQGQLRKVFSAAGIIFKGSGWHVKDYADTPRSNGKGAASDGASGDAGTVPSSGGDATTSGDGTDSKSSKPSKPASKPETSSPASSPDTGSRAGAGTSSS